MIRHVGQVTLKGFVSLIRKLIPEPRQPLSGEPQAHHAGNVGINSSRVPSNRTHVHASTSFCDLLPNVSPCSLQDSSDIGSGASHEYAVLFAGAS